MQANTHRLQFIDVLRGIVIFLVVYYHVKGRFDIQTSFVDNLFMCVRMHIFFFISGFVSYKPFHIWNRELIIKQVSDKVRCLLIPTILFYSIFCLLIYECNPFSYLIAQGWKGYWFTIALFEVLLLYYAISYLTRDNSRFNLLILISICFFDIFVFHVTGKEGVFWCVSGFGSVLNYLPFYITGLIFRRCFDNILGLLENWCTLIILFILTVSLFLVIYKTNSLPVKFYNFVYCWPLRWIYMLLIVNVFVKYRHCFDKRNLCNTIMAYLGKYSLEIYLIHYFFIFYSDNIYQFLNSNDIHISERLFILVLSILIIFMCLSIGYLIRKNRVLKSILFPMR